MPKPSKKPAPLKKADWDTVDSPELSDEFIARMQPVRVARPELIELQETLAAKRGRPRVAAPKKQQTLRLSDRVLDHFKAQGARWQTKISDALESIVTREERRLSKNAATEVKSMAAKPLDSKAVKPSTPRKTAAQSRYGVKKTRAK